MNNKTKLLRGFYQDYSSADLSRSLQFTVSQSKALQKVCCHGKMPLHRFMLYTLLYNIRSKAEFNNSDVEVCYADAKRLYADLPQPIAFLRQMRLRMGVSL